MGGGGGNVLLEGVCRQRAMAVSVCVEKAPGPRGHPKWWRPRCSEEACQCGPRPLIATPFDYQRAHMATRWSVTKSGLSWSEAKRLSAEVPAPANCWGILRLREGVSSGEHVLGRGFGGGARETAGVVAMSFRRNLPTPWHAHACTEYRSTPHACTYTRVRARTWQHPHAHP